MNRNEMSSCLRCWSVPMLSVLLLFFLTPLFAHGMSVVGNETEVESAVNVTSLSTVDEEEKIEEVSQFTSISSSSDQALSGQKFRDEEVGSGMLEEVFQPTPGTPTSSEGATTTLASPEIIRESAETENFLLHEPVSTSIVKEHVTPFMEEEEHKTEEEATEEMPTLPPWEDAKEDMETTVFDLDHETSPTTPSPTNPPSPSDVTVGFFDSGSHRENLGPPSHSPHELQGRDPTSWSMPDNYDYMTPYDDSVSPTTEDYPYSSTTDSYDDVIFSTTSSKRFPPRLPSNPDFPLPKSPKSTVGAGPRAPPGVVDSVNGSECRQGFVRTNGSCKSPCDLQPNYCFNGGQCYVMEGAQMFCRCNIQDYMWHKGARCESFITEFQVMCIAIGASAFMVLLLFMIVVCFAKKLHVLKTENNKLRKRSSKYRPSSEHHNDNFSLSTIAEGSHPNDDPNSQNKLEDPVKAPPPKEDESLNIQNSLTPKHENHKVLGEENSSEVNSLQNNMM
ncbi:chondroitin sulfate proteoglycan 5-like isoform X7 [Carassius auratus]|uniref:Chondroitin sulfate proteoglycan 5-like isoform X7 n=1 Tax=Carassius auratus TaxID=7957 RepID=A0A6P6R240_CARAU|nr:chondroitin sulfate proteoglycan 5-like isoform X7 [Carassius auratus]